MKHRNLTMLTLVTLTAFVLVGCSLAYADSSVPAGSPSTTPTRYSPEEALQIALTHANVTESEITRQRIEFDYDDGIAEYEIEFFAGATEYDYEIHAQTGEILRWDTDKEKAPVPAAEPAQPTAPAAAAVISSQEAEEIALAHAGFTRDQISRLRTKLDHDDGIAEYEVEFAAGGLEYDYEIHAETGSILSWDAERD